jgi:hypothetical protein
VDLTDILNGEERLLLLSLETEKFAKTRSGIGCGDFFLRVAVWAILSTERDMVVSA